eukprot:TRINITY_DN27053_c0_g2_i1.p1 TRINITY_DN27053_c0_g2~~TRINITY_DN27053_c0_g2_i1.p1  ORF type:complete len:251 (+),score=52.07 TRINITY_DN27053_c0_g2_i1:64-816(+)
MSTDSRSTFTPLACEPTNPTALPFTHQMRTPLTSREANKPTPTDGSKSLKLVNSPRLAMKPSATEEKLKEGEATGLLKLIQRSSCCDANQDFGSWLQKQRGEMDGLFEQADTQLDRRREQVKAGKHVVATSTSPEMETCASEELLAPQTPSPPATPSSYHGLGEEQEPRVGARFIGAAAVLGLPGDTPESTVKRGSGSHSDVSDYDLRRYLVPTSTNSTPAKKAPAHRRQSSSSRAVVVHEQKCQLCVIS